MKMGDVTIETQTLCATITTHGAELVSLKSKETGLEYIWQGNPEFWARHAPVLFPIVGSLKNNEYRYQGKTYQMSQHGFARDKEFQLIEKTETTARFLLESSADTKEIYPFDFKLIITYDLGGDGILTSYQVTNPADEVMYFSIGGHPAFNVPLEEGLTFEDYYLQTSPMKSRILVPISDGKIDLSGRTLYQTNTNLSFSRELFNHDALIFETKGLNSFMICSEKSDHSVRLSYNQLPYVGIWSPYPKEAPFVCIEPWQGITDSVTASGELTEKVGIQKLAPKETYLMKYAITVK